MAAQWQSMCSEFGYLYIMYICLTQFLAGEFLVLAPSAETRDLSTASQSYLQQKNKKLLALYLDPEYRLPCYASNRSVHKHQLALY